MSEDRSQLPGKARLKLARDQGHVAHSRELTSAVGWTTALAALILVAPGLGRTLVEIMKKAITLADLAQPEDAAAWCRGIALALMGPLAVVVLSYVLGAACAHLIQTRGLWTPSRLAPDPSRLWVFRPGRETLRERMGQRGWSAIRGLIVAVVVVAWLRASWPALAGLAALKIGPMASASGALLARLAATLAVTALVLGAADYALSRRRFLTRLKTTRQEEREERRRMEGDASGRGRRRHIARSRQAGPVERTGAGQPA